MHQFQKEPLVMTIDKHLNMLSMQKVRSNIAYAMNNEAILALNHDKLVCMTNQTNPLMSGAISSSGCTFRSKQFTTKPFIVPTAIKATLKTKMGSMKLTATVEITHYKFSCTDSPISIVDNVLNVNKKKTYLQITQHIPLKLHRC